MYSLFSKHADGATFPTEQSRSFIDLRLLPLSPVLSPTSLPLALYTQLGVTRGIWRSHNFIAGSSPFSAGNIHPFMPLGQHPSCASFGRFSTAQDWWRLWSLAPNSLVHTALHHCTCHTEGHVPIRLGFLRTQGSFCHSLEERRTLSTNIWTVASQAQRTILCLGHQGRLPRGGNTGVGF